ncbi:MAG: hypothetical protein U9R26_02590 [Campylobacterota bacterium]|nr:hypothetical protein [Campylobacterota bacterium]
MSKITLTPGLAKEYRQLYKSSKTKAKHFDETDMIVSEILEDRERYEAVSARTGVPWYLVAAIHNLESGRDFTRHLHNGDPLIARTVHVPAGRPAKGKPPFLWEESAIDALKLRRLDKVKEWTLSRLLYELEGYNGWGYRLYHPFVLSPYLWAGSQHYASGKYLYDGRWSDRAVSRQIGGALLIRRMEERGEIELQETTEEPIFLYSNTCEPYAKALQEFLNSFEGITLRVDGWPGEKTSNAVQELFGFYLKGDPRQYRSHPAMPLR